jgi:hypothetical protein
MKKFFKILVVGACLGFATYNGFSPGPDDGGGQTPVPDGGATLALLAVAVVGLAGVARRSLKK